MSLRHKALERLKWRAEVARLVAAGATLRELRAEYRFLRTDRVRVVIQRGRR